VQDLFVACGFNSTGIQSSGGAGKRVGAMTSGMYGHRLNASLGLGYIKASEPITAGWLSAQSFEVEIGWQRYPAEVSLRPFYDPEGLRIKA